MQSEHAIIIWIITEPFPQLHYGVLLSHRPGDLIMLPFLCILSTWFLWYLFVMVDSDVLTCPFDVITVNNWYLLLFQLELHHSSLGVDCCPVWKCMHHWPGEMVLWLAYPAKIALKPRLWFQWLILKFFVYTCILGCTLYRSNDSAFSTFFSL